TTHERVLIERPDLRLLPRKFDFFFSSRRRHTSFSRDWSSDVCSSDLHMNEKPDIDGLVRRLTEDLPASLRAVRADLEAHAGRVRSEERRVGKECEAKWMSKQ